MKILNEKKQEELPIDFITQFISKGWDEVGIIKASISAINTEFKNTKAVENCLQDLLDAYLICLSRLEAHLDKKDYIDMPNSDELDNKLDEDLIVNADTIVVTTEADKHDEPCVTPAELGLSDVDLICTFDEPELSDQDNCYQQWIAQHTN